MEPASCDAPVKSGGNASAHGHIQYVKYLPAGYADTHSIAVGYLLWLIGFTGAHRFFFGRPLTGVLWFFTFGLLGIGWLIDVFLIPSMDQEADQKYRAGAVDYNLAWILFVFFGWLGIHRFYQAKILTGLLYFLTGGLFGIGMIYDALTLNEQLSKQNDWRQTTWTF